MAPAVSAPAILDLEGTVAWMLIEQATGS